VEGLILDRNNQSANQPLVLTQVGDDLFATLLSVGDLNPGVGGGVRALFGYRLHDCWALELGYLGVFDQSANASVIQQENQEGLLLPGDLGLAVNNFYFANRIDASYSSSLHSAEANLVCCNCCCECDNNCRSMEWLVGFRYLNLGENFSLTSYDDAESVSTYAVRTRNQLYGAQVGGRLRRCVGRWSFEGTGKAGLFGNDARQYSDAIVDFPDNFEVRPATWASRTQVAFAGELNFTGIYQINNVWGLRAGYNLLWLEGLALAPDQLDFTNLDGISGTGIASSGGVFMHGVSVGLEARW